MDIVWNTDDRGYPQANLKLFIPSVSRILSETIEDTELEAWIKEVGEEKAQEIMQNAAHRGTSLHKYMEVFIKDFALSKNKESSYAFAHKQSYNELLKENIPIGKINKGLELFNIFYYSYNIEQFRDIISTEFKIYSPIHFYRGALDILYKYNNLRLTDYKTSSKKIEKDTIKEYKYKCQLGAYSNAIDELLLLKGSNKNVEYASLLIFLTNDSNLQEIILEGKELKYYKEEFKTLAIKWHINNNQEFLIKNKYKND